MNNIFVYMIQVMHVCVCAGERGREKGKTMELGNSKILAATINKHADILKILKEVLLNPSFRFI